MNLDKAIKGRKSVRHFSSKTPNWRKIIECIDAARYAPRAGNIFPLRFVIVNDEKIIEKLAEAAQQSFIAEARYVVVVCSDKKLMLSSFEDRTEKYIRQQAGASIQNFLLKIEEAGLETCWIGHFVDYLVKEAIGASGDVEVEAMFPIGKEATKMGAGRDEKYPVIDLDNVLYFNKWKNKRMKKTRVIEA